MGTEEKKVPYATNSNVFYACPSIYDKHYEVIQLKASYHFLSFPSGRQAALATLTQSQTDKTDDQRPKAHTGL